MTPLDVIQTTEGRKNLVCIHVIRRIVYVTEILPPYGRLNDKLE